MLRPVRLLNDRARRLQGRRSGGNDVIRGLERKVEHHGGRLLRVGGGLCTANGDHQAVNAVPLVDIIILFQVITDTAQQYANARLGVVVDRPLQQALENLGEHVILGFVSGILEGLEQLEQDVGIISAQGLINSGQHTRRKVQVGTRGALFQGERGVSGAGIIGHLLVPENRQPVVDALQGLGNAGVGGKGGRIDLALEIGVLRLTANPFIQFLGDLDKSTTINLTVPLQLAQLATQLQQRS